MSTEKRWEYIGYEREALVDAEGRILGEISSGYPAYNAVAGNKGLGQYIDKDSAKRAVERALHELP